MADEPEHDSRVAYVSERMLLGNAGDFLVTAISDGGDLSLWVMRACAHSRTDVMNGSTRDATHERLGPLPPEWSNRVRLTQLRCGRPRTGSGLPCRTPVARPGSTCGNHRRNPTFEFE